MLAYVYHSDKTLRLEEKPLPVMGEGIGAVLRVFACSICGTDIRTYRFGSAKIDDGRIVGHEVVGEIIQLAEENRSGFQVGDVVAVAPAIGCTHCVPCGRGKTNMCDTLETLGFQYDGGFAEQMAMPQKAFAAGNVYRLPQSEDYTKYALAEPLACAINAQSYLDIQQGDSVLIFGSGIIGCMHAELALAAGAGQVFLSEPSEERIQQARELLPQIHFIHSSQTDLEEEIMDRTGGRGVDVVIVACSVGPAQAQGLKLLAKCGRISLFGGLAGESTGFIDSNVVHYKELGVFGVHASSPAQNRKGMELIRDGVIDVEKYITLRCPIRELPSAFAAAADGTALKAVMVNR